MRAQVTFKRGSIEYACCARRPRGRERQVTPTPQKPAPRFCKMYVDCGHARVSPSFFGPYRRSAAKDVRFSRVLISGFLTLANVYLEVDGRHYIGEIGRMTANPGSQLVVQYRTHTANQGVAALRPFLIICSKDCTLDQCLEIFSIFILYIMNNSGDIPALIFLHFFLRKQLQLYYLGILRQICYVISGA